LSKLCYLLSKPEFSVHDVRRLMGTPLRGELTRPSQSPAPNQQTIEQNLATIHGVLSQFMRLSTQPTSGPQIIVSPSASNDTPADAAAPWSWTAAEAVSAEASLLPFLIHLAAARNDLESLNFCLSSHATSDESQRIIPGGLVNCLDPASGRSPLHVAALNGSTASVGVLLQSGALVHLRDTLGHTPLYYVSDFRRTHFVTNHLRRRLDKAIQKLQGF
jgi:60kDa lysophospholipase